MTSNLTNLITTAGGYLNSILLLFMGMAVIIFVYNIINYFIKPNESAASRDEAAHYLIWSLVGFFAIGSLWGLVNVISGTFNFSNTNAPANSKVQNLFPSGSGSGTSDSSGSGSNVFNTSNPVSGTSANAALNNGSYGTGGGTINASFGISIGGNNRPINTTGNFNYANYGPNSGVYVQMITPQQAAYARQQADQYSASLRTNNCYTSSGGIVATPACQTMYAQYTTAQTQASKATSSCAPGDYDPSCFSGTNVGNTSSGTSGTRTCTSVDDFGECVSYSDGSTNTSSGGSSASSDTSSSGSSGSTDTTSSDSSGTTDPNDDSGN